MIDLHVHSTYSDGTLNPQELIRLAAETGVEALALCDHNTVAGLPEFLAAAEGSGIEAIPGVEFSTDFGERELHILGLFIQPQHYSAVTALVNELWQQPAFDPAAGRCGNPSGLRNHQIPNPRRPGKPGCDCR